MSFVRSDVLKLTAALVLTFALVLPAVLLAQQGGKVEVLWLGQATFKITSPGGKVIVLDPFLVNNPKTPLPTALKLLPGLNIRHLQTMAKSWNIKPQIKQAALKLVIQRGG